MAVMATKRSTVLKLVATASALTLAAVTTLVGCQADGDDSAASETTAESPSVTATTAVEDAGTSDESQDDASGTAADDAAAAISAANEAAAASAMEAEMLAAAALMLRHAGDLVPAATHGGMTDADLSAEQQAIAEHGSVLAEQLSVLAQGGDGAGRISELADQLLSYAQAVAENRPELLAAIGASDENLRQLGVSSTAVMFPAAISSVDDQFATLIGRPQGSSERTHEEDVLRYQQLASLAADLAMGHTLLSVVSQMQDPTYVARIQERFDSAADRIGRSIEYLAAAGGSELAPRLIALARQQLAAGSGQNNYFDALRLRLGLAQAESDLIAQAHDAADQLLYEVESFVAALRGLPAPTAPAGTDPGTHGITDDTVLFGQSAAFSGPASALGDGMRLGIEAAFHEANQAGGVHGRQLELAALNDAYEADFAFANTLRLIEDEQVFALVGAVGTPTSRAASPLAHAANVPFIAPFTGAELLRAPELANVVNLRASYYQETEEMVERLTSDLGITRVAVLYQNDSYGVGGLEGVRAALERRGLEPVASWYYRRNTTAVNSAVFRIAEADPEAVIIIGAYAPAAEAVRLLRDDVDPIFMAVSFVGSNALAAELGDEAAGFYVTQVVNLPDDTSIPVVASYQAALRDFDQSAEPGFVSLEGYLAGRLAIAGLEACGPDVSRKCFLDAVYGAGTIDIDGLELEFAPGDNQGSDEVILTVIGEDGKYRRVDRLEPVG